MILAEGLHDRYVDTHLDWVRDLHKRSLKKRDGKDHRQGIQHTYRAKSIGFHGYAGSFSDDVLEEIKRHNHVGVALPTKSFQDVFVRLIFFFSLSSLSRFCR